MECSITPNDEQYMFGCFWTVCMYLLSVLYSNESVPTSETSVQKKVSRNISIEYCVHAYPLFYV